MDEVKIKIGQNTYKLILIDTNALREIVTNTNLSGKGFPSRRLQKGKEINSEDKRTGNIPIKRYTDGKLIERECIGEMVRTNT